MHHLLTQQSTNKIIMPVQMTGTVWPRHPCIVDFRWPCSNQERTWGRGSIFARGGPFKARNMRSETVCIHEVHFAEPVHYQFLQNDREPLWAPYPCLCTLPHSSLTQTLLHLLPQNLIQENVRDVIKTRESETKTRPRPDRPRPRPRPRPQKSGLDRSRDQDQGSRYVRNVVV